MIEGLSLPKERVINTKHDNPNTASVAPNVRIIMRLIVTDCDDKEIVEKIIISVFRVRSSKLKSIFKRWRADKIILIIGIMINIIKIIIVYDFIIYTSGCDNTMRLACSPPLEDTWIVSVNLYYSRWEVIITLRACMLASAGGHIT